jgi:hypothetical protein
LPKEAQMANKSIKILNILSHKGNANQNCIEILSHSSQNGYHQRNKQQQMLVKLWVKGSLIHCWWECKLV